MIAIVNAILAHAISVAVGALAAMLLPIRRPGLYWLVVLSQIPVYLAKWAFSMDISYINVACFVFYYAVVPLLFWDAALPARSTSSRSRASRSTARMTVRT